MKKVVFIPLDERPCNYYYPSCLMNKDYDLVMPDAELMGKKKTPAKLGKLKEWILKETADADILAVSLDTLIFGGIVPSRLNTDDIETLMKRSDILSEIKSNNPDIIIYAFELIMRCPGYSSGDEEPDYYENVGYEIHMLGEYTQKEKLGIITGEERKLKEEYRSRIKEEYLNDFLSRREKNLKILLKNLSYVKSGVVDYFIIPQDDTSVYGYTTMDKETVFNYIKENNLESKTAVYPSADDTGLTVLSRALTHIKNESPLIYVSYACEKGGDTIPSFEDQRIDDTMNYQITSAGCKRTYEYEKADIVLFVNIGTHMTDYKNRNQFHKELFVDRNIDEFVKNIKDAINDKKVTALADVCYPNGSDPDLMKALNDAGLLLKLSSYAGWNTSSNTLGTTISFAVHYYFDRDEKRRTDFLLLRYAEDYAYMSKVRSDVTENDLASIGCDYFNLHDKNKEVSGIIRNKISEVLKNDMPCVYHLIKSMEVSQPWNRMFETFIKLEGRENEENN